jgi:hypothetical protein
MGGMTKSIGSIFGAIGGAAITGGPWGAALGGALGTAATGGNKRDILMGGLFSGLGSYAGASIGNTLGQKFGGAGLANKLLGGVYGETLGGIIGAGLGSGAFSYMKHREAKMWKAAASDSGNYRAAASYNLDVRDVERAAERRLAEAVSKTAPQIFRPTRAMKERNRQAGEPTGNDRPRALVTRDAVERATEDRTKTGGYYSGPHTADWSKKYGVKKKTMGRIRYADINKVFFPKTNRLYFK